MPLRASAGSVLGADIIERCDLTGGQVIEPTPDSDERVLVREDLRGLLQGFVLVDRDEDRGRTAAPSDRDMLAAIGHLVEEIGEVGTELPDGNGLRTRTCRTTSPEADASSCLRGCAGRDCAVPRAFQ